jgi:hypothetical protein
MNDLEAYFEANDDRLIHKWTHYFEIYDRYFSRYRGTEVHMLEIGVSQGGSLQMWKNYFGPKAHIYGVDINPECKRFEEDQIKVFIGDQTDREFLGSLRDQIPRIDILLDDGGHRCDQQICTYEELFPAIDENGVYACEDLQTSYWKGFGGGLGRRGSFIEYAKNFVDQLNAWHSREDRFKIDDFTRSAYGVHFYDAIAVIEKRPMTPPEHKETGHATIPMVYYPNKPTLRKRVKHLFKGKKK